MRIPRSVTRAALGIVLVLVVLLPMLAFAQAIPRDAYRYRADLTRAARNVWGLDAPVATFAAQIHQESRWRETAVSSAGAQGVAQFMPATAQWIGGAYTALGPGDPTNPVWAMRALVTYDKHIHERINAATPCDRMWMTLWGYNGGPGWVTRDQAKARQAGADPRRASAVEPLNAGRNPAAFAENRGYPRLILGRFEPIYVRAGFGQGSCA
jgi:soluble lytic murein transglycosylase-like protein